MKRFLISALLLAFSSLSAHAIEIQQVRSPKGISAWLVEDHSNPIISLSLSFKGGAALDPAGKEGLANFVASTIDEGAGDLDSQAFQGAMQNLSIQLGYGAGRESFSGHLQTLSENRDMAFKLLRLSINEPRFDDEAVKRIRAQITMGLRQNSQKPGPMAAKAFYSQLFPNHPYAKPVAGTLESVATFSKKDFQELIKRRLAKNNLVLGVVGDISAKELSVLLDKTFGDLPEKATEWALPEVKPSSKGGVTVVDLKVPQSSILFGQEGLKRHDPDFYPAYVLNYVLGGGSFASRLFAEVREKRGLAYSAYSYLAPLDHTAIWAGGAGTANERVKETIDVVKAEWKRMAEKGVSQQELNDAKTYLTGSYHLRFSSSREIAQILVSIQVDNLGVDFLDRRNSLVEAVTLDQVNKVAKRLLDPEKLIIVVAGQPKGL